MHDDFDLLMAVHYPDDLAEAFGYNGDARYVGFYWDHAGDELTWLDGRRSLCGAECQYFLKFALLHQTNKHRSVIVTPCPLTTCSSIENPIIFMSVIKGWLKNS